MERNVIFIGGSIRTGTSVLQSVLCSSPETHPFIHECHYLTTHMQLYRRWKDDFTYWASDYFGDINNLGLFTRSIIEQFIEIAWNRFQPKKVLVLKDPELSYFFPDLTKMFPKAKFVVSVRNPKDAVASMLSIVKRQQERKQNGGLVEFGRDMRKFCDKYNSYYEQILKMWPYSDQCLSNRICYIRHEDLVQKTEETVSRLEDFCRISLNGFNRSSSWNTRVNIDELKAHSLFGPWFTPLHGKGLSEQSIGRYKEVLSEDEIRQVDHHCADISRIFYFK